LASEPESDPDDFLSESDPELSAFLAAFLTGFSSEELSSEELAAFLTSFLDFLAGAGESDDESESEDDSTLAFFCGTTAFSDFFCALLALPLEAAETFEAALDLF